MTTKKIVSQHVGASNINPGPFGGGDPLPTALTPVPPSTTEAPVTRVGARRGPNPSRVQVQAATRAAEEVRASPDKYTEIFGVRVPGPTTMADSLAYAAGWSASLAAAERWAAYCATQNRLAWTHSLGLLERLDPIAQAPGSTAEADLPELTSVVTARTLSGKRAAATRRAKKAAVAKAAAASETPVTAETTAATVVTPVATAEPGNAVTK